MLTGFRAGDDPTIGITADDFTATRRAWGLPAGTATIGRVFPNGPNINPATTPAQVIAKLDKAAAPVRAAGMWPYLSLKPDPAAVIAGKMDAHLTAIGKWAVAAGTRVYLSFHHEPENDTLGVAATNYLGRAQTFVSMHTRAYHVVKAAAGDKALIGPCHLVYKWDKGSPETATGAVATAWRVPDDARDFMAADAYTSNWSWVTVGARLAEKRDFNRWMTLLDVPADQLILAERGISRTRDVSGPADQAAVLTADYQDLADMGAHALIYWNSGGATDDSVYLLGPAGRQAFTAAAIDAASPRSPVDERSYQTGYDAGLSAGMAKGIAAGRQSVLTALGGWVTQQSSATS